MSDNSSVNSSYEPKKATIGQLLSLSSPPIIVPEWQRNYSWEIDNIVTFWSDIVSFIERERGNLKNEYFLGSIVTVKNHDGALELLDGQQRIATSAILISSIRDQVKRYNAGAARQLQESFLVGYDFLSNKPINKLQLNVYDRDFFRRLVLVDRDGDYEEPKPKIASHYLIKQARSRFDHFLIEYVFGLEPQAAFQKQMQIANCLLRHMTVIAIESASLDSAAEVFETLNDRGISLSTPDLLRNLVIRRASDADRPQIIKYWEDVIGFDSDTTIKSFIRHYWISMYGDIKTQSLYREIKGRIINDNISSLGLSEKLSDAAGVYAYVKEAKTGIQELDALFSEASEYGASSNSLLPVLIGILDVLDNLRDQTCCIQALVNVYVRHTILVGLENSKFDNVIYKAVRNLRLHRSTDQFIGDISSSAPSDAQVVASFEEAVATNKKSRRAILCRLELVLRKTGELQISNSSSVHVEHVYPQNPEKSKELEQHEYWINRYGSLSLLSGKLNRMAKNYDFERKKKYFTESNLMLSNQLSEYSVWGAEQIADRQKWMATLIPEAYPLPKI